MIPKRVSLENFLSYGQKTEIAFTDDEPLWVLSGSNGVGKSAVFDAITYCLFAEHRGGSQGHDQLIHHGANGFSLEFDFEFAGVDYRIARNRIGRRTTQSVEQRLNGTWGRVPNIDSAADVKTWVERTIGLSCSAFTSSVLLPQGKADELLEATPATRLELLKKIIGVERFEQLSKQVAEKSKAKRYELTRLEEERCRRTEVTSEQLATAAQEVQLAEIAKADADLTRQATATAVVQARQWVRLEQQRLTLSQRLNEAAIRTASAVQIRTDFARYTLLSSQVPNFQRLILLRQSLLLLQTDLRIASANQGHYQEEFTRLTQDLEAHRLIAATRREEAARFAARANTATAERNQQQAYLGLASDIAELQQGLGEYEQNLDDNHVAIVQQLQRLQLQEESTQQEVTELSTLLKQAQHESETFAKLETGVTCYQCGQIVTAEHADRERQRVQGIIRNLEVKLDSAQKTLKSVQTERKQADSQRDQFQQLIQARDQIRIRLADQQRTFTNLGGVSDVATIQAEVNRLNAELIQIEANHTSARASQVQAENDLDRLASQLRESELRLSNATILARNLSEQCTREQTLHDHLLSQIPSEWQEIRDCDSLQEERKQLAMSGIEQRFRDLEEDTVRCGEWQKQLEQVQCDIESIPEAQRVSVPDAETRSQNADTVFRNCEAHLRRVTGAHDNLLRQHHDYHELSERILEASRAARIHGKLDTLLGKQKLQRELIREAEAQIVHLANHTVKELSGGELSISLAQSEEGDDKAFDLLVRRGDSQTPIGVKYLSGSQKFRVAISVALAIGRFAAGQARPLECVIIDEGFGSLDKDGLNATAQELNRLKSHLKRIILVSHQEEFTSQFPVVIRLSPGEHGTVAEQIRQNR